MNARKPTYSSKGKTTHYREVLAKIGTREPIGVTLEALFPSPEERANAIIVLLPAMEALCMRDLVERGFRNFIRAEKDEYTYLHADLPGGCNIASFPGELKDALKDLRFFKIPVSAINADYTAQLCSSVIEDAEILNECLAFRCLVAVTLMYGRERSCITESVDKHFSKRASCKVPGLPIGPMDEARSIRNIHAAQLQSPSFCRNHQYDLAKNGEIYLGDTSEWQTAKLNEYFRPIIKGAHPASAALFSAYRSTEPVLDADGTIVRLRKTNKTMLVGMIVSDIHPTKPIPLSGAAEIIRELNKYWGIKKKSAWRRGRKSLAERDSLATLAPKIQELSWVMQHTDSRTGAVTRSNRRRTR